MIQVKTRFRLIRRGIRGGAYYCVDSLTKKRTSLDTASEDEARQIVEAKNRAEQQPLLNVQIAKAYLAGVDARISTRTWKEAIDNRLKVISRCRNLRADGFGRDRLEVF